MDAGNIAAISALAGAFIGAAGPIAAYSIHEHRQRNHRAKHLTLAVAGEIAAVLDIVRRRGYVDGILLAADAAKLGAPFSYTVSITYDYFPVLENTLSDIGLLPDTLSALIPRFLTFAKAALEDLEAINRGVWSTRTDEELATSYQELGEVFQEAIAIGTEIIAIAERRYGFAR